MGLEVKKGEYAKLKGWRSPAYVTKLIAKGIVVLSADGKRVDVEASNRNLEAGQAVDRQGLRDHHARARLDAELEPRSAGAGEPARDLTPPAAGGGVGAKGPDDFKLFNQARAKKEAELARMAELEREEREGKLVATDAVKQAAGRVAEVIVRGLDRISPRIAAKVAAESDEVKCALLIEDELRVIREEFAEELVKITGPAAVA
jgi:hypothetical protein